MEGSSAIRAAWSWFSSSRERRRRYFFSSSSRPFLDRGLRGLLHVGVERRVDRRAVLLREARDLLRLAQHEVHEVRRDDARRRRRDPRERRRVRGVEGRPVDLLLLEHPPEDDRAPLPRVLGVPERRVLARRRDEAREQGGLGQLEARGALAEVEARGLLDARHGDRAALAEVDLVEVRLEDLVLRVFRLEDDRHQGLDGLALERALGREEHVLHELLRQGRRPADARAPRDALEDGADEAPRGDPGVREEVAVLRREDRVEEDLRHLAERHERAVLHLLVEDGADDLGLEDDVRKRRAVLDAAHATRRGGPRTPGPRRRPACAPTRSPGRSPRR